MPVNAPDGSPRGARNDDRDDCVSAPLCGQILRAKIEPLVAVDTDAWNAIVIFQLSPRGEARVETGIMISLLNGWWPGARSGSRLHRIHQSYHSIGLNQANYLSAG